MKVKALKVHGQVLALSDRDKSTWEWFRVDRFPAPITIFAAAKGDVNWLNFLRDEIVSKLLAKSKYFADLEEVVLYWRLSVYRRNSAQEAGDALTALAFDVDDGTFDDFLTWLPIDGLTVIPTRRGFHIIVALTRGIDPLISNTLKDHFNIDLNVDVHSIEKPRQLFRFPYRVETVATKAISVVPRESLQLSSFWGENWKLKELRNPYFVIESINGGNLIDIEPYGDLKSKVEETIRKMTVRHYREARNSKSVTQIPKAKTVKNSAISTEMNAKEIIPLLISVRGANQTALIASLILEGKITARTAGAAVPMSTAITLVWKTVEKSGLDDHKRRVVFRSLTKLRKMLSSQKVIKGPGDIQSPSWRVTEIGIEYYGQRMRDIWGDLNLKTGLPAVLSWLRVDAKIDLGFLYGNLNRLALKILRWWDAVALARSLFREYIAASQLGPIKALIRMGYDSTKARRVANVLTNTGIRGKVSLKLFKLLLKWVKRRIRRWTNWAQIAVDRLIKWLIRKVQNVMPANLIAKHSVLICANQTINFAFVKLQE